MVSLDTSAPNSCRIRLDDTTDVSQAADLKACMIRALVLRRPIRIELGRAGAADTAVIQLLIALHREAQIENLPLEWHEPSATLLRSIELCGAEESCGLRHDPPASTADT